MAQTNKKPLIWILSAVVVIVIIAGIAFAVLGGNDNDTEPQDAAPTTSGSSPSAPSTSQQDTPGARIDSEQRSWPDPSGYFDDSSLATPGSTGVDPLYQRPAHVPTNHDGDLPNKDDLVNSMDSCKQQPVILSGTTQQQYVNARFLAVNDQAGPTTMQSDVPGGYAHSPQGGITAAVNQLGYGLYGVGDEVGDAIDSKLWSTSDTAQEAIGDPSAKSQSARDNARAPQLSIPWGYKVQTCAEDVMVVDVLLKGPDDVPSSRSEGNQAAKITLKWKDGDWVPDFTGNADADIAQSRIIPDEEVEDYTEVELS